MTGSDKYKLYQFTFYKTKNLFYIKKTRNDFVTCSITNSIFRQIQNSGYSFSLVLFYLRLINK